MIRYWEKLSGRERRLAALTAAVIVATAAVLLISKTLNRIEQLDSTIAQLEQDLLNYRAQEARGLSVDKAFAAVAGQHSSSWTEAEIHNRLRQEIYRLALEDPYNPTKNPSKLVEIPTLRQGTLKEGGAGYREYQLSIKIPHTDIYSLLMFLLRLLSSPQSLRIDALDIGRAPSSQWVASTITVTRTVVDGAPASADAPPPQASQESPEDTGMAWDGGALEGWQVQGATLELAAAAERFYTSDGDCLKAQAKTPAGGEPAAVFWTQELETGVAYELLLDAIGEGPATLEVRLDGAPEPLAQGEPLMPDGKPYHYRHTFTVPGAPGERAPVQAPYVRIAGEDAAVYLDNVTVRKEGK